MGSYMVASNRELVRAQLGITHMVNASSSPPPFPGEFEYLDMDLQDESRQALTPLLPRFFDFMRKALQEIKMASRDVLRHLTPAI